MANNNVNDWEEVPVDDWQEMPVKADEVPFFSTSGLTKGLLQALPAAGTLFGGAAGTILGPAGTVAGAGLGAMAGKALEQTGEKLFFDQGPETRTEQYKQLGLEGLYGVSSEMGGKVLGKGIEAATPYLAKAGTKIGHALTGVSEKEIETYAKNADKIKQMAKETDANTLEAADIIRQKFNTEISTTKNAINSQIDDILSTSTKQVESQPIIDALNKYKGKLPAQLEPEQINQINEFISRISAFSKEGKISANEANQVKRYLQSRASSAYGNGNIFQIGTEAANAAKDGAAIARKLVDDIEPKVTNLNSTLSKLHNIEDNMNLNILKIGAPEAALMSAGSGGNVRNVQALKELGEITGIPMLQEAENLAAMRTFSNAPIMPVDVTGKSATRMGAAGAIGAAIGGAPGAIVGGALSSPLMLKSAIDVGRTIGKGMKAISPVMQREPTREMLYKGILQKYQEQPKKEEKPKSKPDQSSILNKVQGSPYAQILNNALQTGGDTSFAAANYVLMNRDENYRKLINEEEV